MATEMIGVLNTEIVHLIEGKIGLRYCPECNKIVIGFGTWRCVGNSWGKKIWRVLHIDCARDYDIWKDQIPLH